MIKFVADENFRDHIINGLREREPSVDLVRVQDIGLASTPDPDILEWAADTGRIVLTHDVATMPVHATDRLNAGVPMQGLFLIPQSRQTGEMIDELQLIMECSSADEWTGQITYLPL